ncbi:hypothetical protein SDC49_09915 [Lactobacillus sp. R2/2]|nr:hypothetical protein [Lactobacillus sp. R2/2]
MVDDVVKAAGGKNLPNLPLNLQESQSGIPNYRIFGVLNFCKFTKILPKIGRPKSDRQS